MFEQLFEYIINNKNWIFSGIGVLLLSWGKNYFSKKKNESNTSPPEPVYEKVSTPPKQVPQKHEVTEVQKICNRFKEVVSLINEGRHPEYSIFKLAEIMNLQKGSELENVLNGKKEPDFEFIALFCNTFGVNREWMTQGVQSPFSNNAPTRCYPIEYFEGIKKINPERIYFIRANTDISEAFILLKITDYKFKIIQNKWHISEHVGGTGENQLVSLYKLINKLRNDKFDLKCAGQTLDSKKFEPLYSGEVFPGNYVDCCGSACYWWNDLTDIKYQNSDATKYEKWYGKSFVAAQRIIKSRLNRDKL